MASRGMTIGTVVAVVVVGAAAAGWVYTTRSAPRDRHAAPPSPTAVVGPTGSGEPSPIESLQPLVMPDLVGQDFADARRTLRGFQLGVRLVFAADGTDRSVRATDPPAGAPVPKGITVKVYVRGAAPLLTPPDLVGRSCNEAGHDAAEAGLYPQYPSGRSGVVTAENPSPDADDVHWNDTIYLYCGADPSPSAP
ncbi:MAG TPA: PASTA domain-containing protein [Micromonosporaceae bacterium]